MFLNALSKLTHNEAKAAAHQPEDMIKACSFEKSPEKPACIEFVSGATSFFSAQYGFCYTFNYHENDVFSAFPGPALGLELDVDIEEKYYLRNGLSQTGGAKLVIHESNSAPLLTSAGYDLMPGTQIDIGIRMVNISR